MDMHQLMGSSPVVDRSAVGNSVSPLNLDILGRHGATASDVDIEIPSTPKVCLAFRSNSPNTDTSTIRDPVLAEIYHHTTTMAQTMTV